MKMSSNRRMAGVIAFGLVALAGFRKTADRRISSTWQSHFTFCHIGELTAQRKLLALWLYRMPSKAVQKAPKVALIDRGGGGGGSGNADEIWPEPRRRAGALR